MDERKRTREVLEVHGQHNRHQQETEREIRQQGLRHGHEAEEREKKGGEMTVARRRREDVDAGLISVASFSTPSALVQQNRFLIADDGSSHSRLPSM